jgi:hypothetical protein
MNLRLRLNTLQILFMLSLLVVVRNDLVLVAAYTVSLSVSPANLDDSECE